MSVKDEGKWVDYANDCMFDCDRYNGLPEDAPYVLINECTTSACTWVNALDQLDDGFVALRIWMIIIIVFAVVFTCCLCGVCCYFCNKRRQFGNN